MKSIGVVKDIGTPTSQIERNAFRLKIFELTRKHCRLFDCAIFVSQNRYSSEYQADIKITQSYQGKKHKFDMSINVQTNIKPKFRGREAVVHWNTMGAFSTDYIRQYMKLVRAATKLAEQINEQIYNEEK